MKSAIASLLKKMPMLESILKMPMLESISKSIRKAVFPGSADYWESRYSDGETSGAGSYGRLAEFKAEFINSFVAQKAIVSVIEFGCGDGNQLALANYHEYTGLDVSKKALSICKARFKNDKSKNFILYNPENFKELYGNKKADMAISLDVVYHLVEDDVFEEYMSHLFDSALDFVIIYSSNFEGADDAPHMRHRCFTEYVKARFPSWDLMKVEKNPFPYDKNDPQNTSLSDYYIFAKK